MLALAAMRLAAIEVLCPTAKLDAGTGFPTMAGKAVLDSRETALQDLDTGRAYTPVIGVYSSAGTIERRSGAADATDNLCTGYLDIVCELAAGASDADIFPIAENDAEAKLVLDALTAQVRWLLDFSEAGALFRRTVMSIMRIDEMAFGAPDLNVRYLRNTMRVTATLPNDEFTDDGGLPEPLKSLFEELPDGSYSKAKLAQLGAHFAGQTRTPLKVVKVSDTREVGDPPAPIWPTLGVNIPQD